MIESVLTVIGFEFRILLRQICARSSGMQVNSETTSNETKHSSESTVTLLSLSKNSYELLIEYGEFLVNLLVLVLVSAPARLAQLASRMSRVVALH
jgi:hypothetical protein